MASTVKRKAWEEMERLKRLSDDALIAEWLQASYLDQHREAARHREIFWTGIGYIIGGALLALGARSVRRDHDDG